MKEKDLTVVYMVAGVSSRFGGKMKSFASVGPKGETLIEYSLTQALNAGFNKIIFIVSKYTEPMFKERFGDNYKGAEVKYALQKFDEKERDKPWGTLDALCTIRNIVDCPFVVCAGDDIYGEDTFKLLAKHFEKEKVAAVPGYRLAEVVPDKGTVNRGVFSIDENGFVKELHEVFGIEKNNLRKTNSKEDDFCSMLIFALYPETVEMLTDILEEFKSQHKGDRKIESLLPNALSSLIENGKLKMKLYPVSNKWFGITHPQDEDIVRSGLKKI